MQKALTPVTTWFDDASGGNCSFFLIPMVDRSVGKLARDCPLLLDPVSFRPRVSLNLPCGDFKRFA